MPSSEVWKYFEKSQQNDLARCNICGKELKLPGGGTTTSLLTHLTSLHNIILKRKSSEPEDIKPKFRKVIPINSFFTKIRSRLNDDTMDAMIFLRQYYKNKAKKK